MRAGAAREKLALENLDLEYPIESELHCRALYLDGKNSWLLVSYEMTSIRDYEIEKIRQKISKKT